MDNPEQSYDDAVLARYLSGECTPEEQLAIRRWLENDPVRQQRFNRLRNAWNALDGHAAPAFDVQTMRHNIAVGTGAGHHTYRPYTSLSRSAWLFPAAAAVVILGVGIVFATRSSPRAPAIAPEWRQVTTNRWQRADVYLSDGTHVQLAPESRLRFTSPFSDTAREVLLVGQALFDVRHDERRPFRVLTSAGIAEDLGTRFDVRHYAGDTVLKVVVDEGFVAMSAGLHAANRVTLGAGDLGTLGASGEVVVRHTVDVAREIGWANGALSFEAVPLRDVIRDLRRFYDVEFVLANSDVGARRLTATFGRESASEVARVIAVTLELHHEIRGKTVTFAPRGPVQ